MNVNAQPPRLDYLDAVRSFALLLGIVFHAALSFLPVFVGWAVMDVSTSPLVGHFTLISHSFRMELFFLLAGFFSHMTFHRKGVQAFAASRLTRIAIPLVVGWFVLRPLIVSGWVMGGESLRGDVHILNGLEAGFRSLGGLPSGLLTGTHLWFLYYLLLITGIALTLRAVVKAIPGLYARATGLADSTVRWIVDSRFSWPVLAIPIAACLGFMTGWGMDTPDQTLVPHVPVLVVYGGFFAFGWLLHRQAHLVERFARISAGRVAFCGIGVVATILLSPYQADMGHPRLALFRTAFVVSYALMMGSLVSLTIGLFKRFLDRSNKAVRYVADASYWLYLVHLPIVVWLQIAFAELPFHWTLKLCAISVLTVAISLVLYDLFVRNTFVGQVLNGRRKDRVLSPARAMHGERVTTPRLQGWRRSDADF